MITSSTEYDFVSIGQDIKVDGFIMPARDVYDDGSWRVLRGEDAAFCLEAAHERAVVAGTERPTVSSVDRTIRADRWVQTVRALHACAAAACKPTASISGKALPSFIPDSATLPMLYPGIELDESELLSDETRFAQGYGLRADPVRDVFHDVNLLRAFAVNGTATRTDDGYAVTRGGGSTGRPDAHADGSVLVQHVAVRFPDELGRLTGGWTRAQANAGQLVFEAPHDAGAEFHAGSGTLALEFEVEVLDSSATGQDEPVVTRSYYLLAYMVGASLSTGMAGLGNYARDIGDQLGHFYTEQQLDQDRMHIVNVILRSARALVKLDDHTDFSGLNWEWPKPLEEEQ